ncbi:hypothetical protein BC832DRAFT_557699 [Gaertneriomyces semiglobifer]|nr:hypothetical protein BC832DRAFT_557699 [Gaertneriomyces semiglobifer]
MCRVRAEYLRCLQLKKTGRTTVLAIKRIKRLDELAAIPNNGDYYLSSADDEQDDDDEEQRRNELNPVFHRIIDIIRRRKGTQRMLELTAISRQRSILWSRYLTLRQVANDRFPGWFNLAKMSAPDMPRSTIGIPAGAENQEIPDDAFQQLPQRQPAPSRRGSLMPNDSATPGSSGTGSRRPSIIRVKRRRSSVARTTGLSNHDNDLMALMLRPTPETVVSVLERELSTL